MNIAAPRSPYLQQNLLIGGPGLIEVSFLKPASREAETNGVENLRRVAVEVGRVVCGVLTGGARSAEGLNPQDAQ